MSHPLILASSSPYRRALLERLRVPFQFISPDVDERLLPDENPRDSALRLAVKKARAVDRNDAVIIGADQLAALGDQVLGKPGTLDRAIDQLMAASGQIVDFYTGLAVISPGQDALRYCDHTQVRFRTLPRAEVERYVDAEQPLDCAGSFKCEGLGISLFESIESNDPTALIGLPLIRLAGMLRKAGYSLP